MVDTRDSKSRDSNIMRVQVPPSALGVEREKGRKNGSFSVAESRALVKKRA